jgi:hypothetical protein
MAVDLEQIIAPLVRTKVDLILIGGMAAVLHRSARVTFDVEAFGVKFKCFDLPTVIRIKEATGRSKDNQAVAELRVLLEEKESTF